MLILVILQFINQLLWNLTHDWHPKNIKLVNISSALEVRFSSFFSGGFITAILVNPPEWKLVKHTFV